MMKIAVLGATGWIGSHVVSEAESRGHEVVKLVRDSNKVSDVNNEVRQLDLNHTQIDFKSQLRDIDILVSAVAARSENNTRIFPDTAKRLLDALPNTQVKRLIWVGGAGSLEVAPGVPLVSVPDFPSEYKAEALAQGDALDIFRAQPPGVSWTFISPAAEIFPGEKLDQYRITSDALLTDADGNSRISVADYALALVDEIEQAKHQNQRMGVAY